MPGRENSQAVPANNITPAGKLSTTALSAVHSIKSSSYHVSLSSDAFFSPRHEDRLAPLTPRDLLAVETELEQEVGLGIPIKIAGQRDDPAFGLDARRVFRRGDTP